VAVLNRAGAVEADCSNYHAGAWALRVAAWRLFLGAASIAATAPAANAQVATGGEPDQLPPVTIILPETTKKQQARPSRLARRAGNSRPAAADPAVAAATPTANGVAPAASDVGDLRSAGAASEKRISGEELNARPAARVGELLEVVPGLIVTQHSGEGKANQYFLRGFNLAPTLRSRSMACRSTCRPTVTARAMPISIS
jgi:hypothetical protein